MEVLFEYLSLKGRFLFLNILCLHLKEIDDLEGSRMHEYAAAVSSLATVLLSNFSLKAFWTKCGFSED